MCNLYFPRYIHCEEGHYQVRLPFRNQSLAVPANRCQARRRALSLKVNSSRTPYSKKTMLHLAKTLSKKVSLKRFPLKIYIEQTTRSSIVHIIGCITARKLRRWRSLFIVPPSSKGCLWTANYSKALIWPMYSLVGIVFHFWQDPVAVMVDVQSIFHQVRVPVEDRGFMRFLWCRQVVISIRVRKSTE